jgi:hypothetical protein
MKIEFVIMGQVAGRELQAIKASIQHCPKSVTREASNHIIPLTPIVTCRQTLQESTAVQAPGHRYVGVQATVHRTAKRLLPPIYAFLNMPVLYVQEGIDRGEETCVEFSAALCNAPVKPFLCLTGRETL